MQWWIETITSKSFVDIKNLRFPNKNDLYIDQLDFIFALEKTVDERPRETLLFLKRHKHDLITVTSISSQSIVELNSFPFSGVVLKVFPLEENLYLFFIEDGSLQLYNAEKHDLSSVPFPGVNCYDIELMFHPRLKPSLVCLNRNLNLMVYYLDELIAKSLSYSLYRTGDLPEASEFTPNSRIYSSEFYPGKVFVHTPPTKQKKVDQLQIFYLEIEDFARFFLLRTIDMVNAQADSLGYTCRINSMMFADQRLAVIYRTNLTKNWVAFYEFNEEQEMQAVVIKNYELPERYLLTDKSLLFKFYRHFQSTSHANHYKPLLAMQISLGQSILRSPQIWSHFLTILPVRTESDSGRWVSCTTIG